MFETTEIRGYINTKQKNTEKKTFLLIRAVSYSSDHDLGGACGVVFRLLHLFSFQLHSSHVKYTRMSFFARRPSEQAVFTAVYSHYIINNEAIDQRLLVHKLVLFRDRVV